MKKLSLFFILSFSLAGCFSYHTVNLDFFNAIEAEKYDDAHSHLKKSDKKISQRDRLLFDMNLAYTEMLIGNHETSSQLFIQVDKNIEDHSKNMGNQALSYVVNSTFTNFQPEDYEAINVNYFNMINFLKMKDLEKALIEAKRGLLKVYKLEDRYKKKNKYKTDAFFLNMIGVIHDAKGEYNDAFVAYRNAYDAYEDIYSSVFQVSTPHQLKIDLIRSAYKSGFISEGEFYENKFGIKYDDIEEKDGAAIVLWNNGVAPHKEEWSLNMITSGSGSFIYIKHPSDPELDFAFPISAFGGSGNQVKSLSTLRLVVPRLVEKKPYFTGGKVLDEQGNTLSPLYLGQDINKIAFKVQKQKFIADLGKSLVRVAIKKSAEAYANEKDETLGSIISIIGSLTEKADTRNWQVIPYSVLYSRIPLSVGKNNLNIELSGSTTSRKTMIVEIEKNKTSFVTLFTPKSKK